MSVGLAAIVVVGGFMLLLALGVEIAIAIGVMSVIGFAFVIDHPLAQVAWTAFEVMDSFLLTAVPLFIFMGAMFANTGVVRSLFDGAEKLIGSLPGGLACATIGASALFGAMSGSSLAAAATFGTIAFPEMERKEYNHRLALGSVVVGGTLSVLIPPSLLLIIYGSWESVSVVRLFAAGMIPGIMLALLFLLTVIIRVKLNPSLAPKPATYTWRERFIAIRNLIPWVGIIGLVLGVIFGGIMTPSEAAALGAFLGIAVALGYRQLTFTALKNSALTTVRVTCMIAFIIVAANLLSFTFHASGLTDAFKAIFTHLPMGKYGAIIFIYIMYFVLGMFIEDISMLVITIPFVTPVIHEFGFPLLWFGVAYVITAEIALVTPPFGLNLFIVKGVVPKYDLVEIALSAVPFYPALIVTLGLITAFPEIALWLPDIMY